ncbi:MAG: FAD-dependent oxidoreductase [Bacteroidia bacterium]|nr:FAD-dependent oxidoreductase [Bacteroidia bacterium]
MKEHVTQKHSNWWKGPENLCPALEKDIRTDVVIVGGGFTGLYTALNLRKAGVEVVILEREYAGSAASGRNSGYVDGLIGKDYPSLLKLNKPERAKELCAFAKTSVESLEQFIKEHQIDCEYIGNGNINAAVHPKQIKRLKLLEEAGKGLELHFKFLDQQAMLERGIPPTFVAGIHDPVGGTLNPGKLVARVRQLAIDAGVKLYENSPVVRIQAGKPIRVETARGVVTADQAVLATNAFTMQLGYKKRFMSPIWAGMFESAPLTQEQRERLKWPGKEGLYTAHEKLESYRLTERGTLIAGGKFVKIPYGFQLDNLSQPKMAAQIEQVFRWRFPELADLDLATFWGGWIGIPLDFMPGIGQIGKNGNLHYGMGYAGHGVPQTLLVGEILAENVQGKQHPLGHVLQRRTFPIPPEPFKWLVSNMVDFGLGLVDRGVDKALAGK